MSSSVFIESSSQDANKKDCDITSDSNLVVVYGKNGISFDDKGLENLIEEKKISSISVVRLTSPTPSMKEEEEESEKLEEMLRRQEIESESGESEEDDRNSFGEDTENSDSLNGEDNEGRKGSKEPDNELSDEEKFNKKRQLRRRGRQPNAVKQKKSMRKPRRDRPEIVGLRLEEFYPYDDANEIIKEALKMAGLRSDKKSRTDYDFQLFVIQNDHCYTPFTSPAQMKAKLAADKLEAEKHVASRKTIILQQTAGKQLYVRKKLQQLGHSKSENVAKLNNSPATSIKDKNISGAHKPRKDRKNISEDLLNEENLRLSYEENEDDNAVEDQSDLSGSDYSAETDNDRDSDLDFDVNNPKGRKRKTKLLKTHKRSLNMSKSHLKSKRYHSQDEFIDLPNKPNVTSNVASGSVSTIIMRQKPFVKVTSDTSRTAVRSTPSKVVQMLGQGNALSPAVAALPPIPKKQNENKSVINKTGMPTSVTLATKSTKFILVKNSAEQKSANQSPTQTHREIVINKQVMSSPKTKGFTDLTKLIEQTEKQTTIKTIAPSTVAKSSHTATATSLVTYSPTTTRTTTTLKGFMPIEAVAKTQLPTQISIQSHQSSSELEAEHDKQLDLINSIVQNEMQKLNEKTDDQIVNNNKNIPELVKMLESTEKVLVSSSAQQNKVPKMEQNINQLINVIGSNHNGNSTQNIINMSSVTASPVANNQEGEIDISSTSLLAADDGDGGVSDDLPDDILQQVVELIKDDKSFQEAVEKQVFGTSVCNDERIGNNNNILPNQNPPPLAPISQQPSTIQENAQSSSKSIIQLAISNVPISPTASPIKSNAIIATNAAITSPTPTSTTATFQDFNQASKSSLVRKEPIQIIRGNGRVITLPPIEAPTTRAKRRAQVQPNHSSTTTVPNTASVSTSILSESSLDSSMHSNSSMTAVSSNSGATMQDKKVMDTNNRRRSSKESSTTTTPTTSQKSTKPQKSVAKKGGSKSSANKSKVETGPTESEEDDDDDPNKLWCICRQPHNNRFMICCDVCEDWFHGTCVNITKAMGLEMEQKGIDWTCPKCIKKQEDKRQPKITEMLTKKFTDSNSCQSDEISSGPTFTSSDVVQNTPVTKATAGNIDILNITPKKEYSAQKLETTQHLKLQSGQIINLKDLSSTNTKRTSIIQTSISSTSALTSGQKKFFITSGHGNINSQPGTPIKTITVVKQLGSPQHHYSQNIKIIKTSAATSSTSQNVNTVNTSFTVSPVVSSSCSTTAMLPSASTSTHGSTCCIVCKKLARSNSIYCTDDCIRKHAQNALNSLMNKSQVDTATAIIPSSKNTTEDKTKKRSKGLFEELLSAADRKPKVERVNVYERKSGRIITGNSAPTAANLKKWLQDNPTFEVIQPGSAQALDLEKKQKLRAQNSSPTSLKPSNSSPPPLKMFSLASTTTANKMEASTASSPYQGHSPQIHTKTNKTISDYLKNTNSNTTSPRPSTPKQLQKYPQNVNIKPDRILKTSEDSKSAAKEKASSTKRQTNPEGKNSNNDGEPIRLVVRRTLKEQLLLRIKEETDSSSLTTGEEIDQTSRISNIPKLTEEEIDEFAKSTELEMYNYFSRDTGTKYKAKYRSLVFNIKDRKNHTLFAKICRKLIEPRQLVRMSPEEMASQELAQWREQENKHQLEMIKKSELDLLACAKNYVLKTHKGEEVIEGKSSDYVNVDITIPVEDVVSAINKSDLANAAALTRKEPQTHYADTEAQSHSHSVLSEALLDEDKSNLKCSQFREKEREKDKERDRGRERDKDKERERDRDKDKERTRGRDREREKRRKSKDRHHDKLRSRKRSRSNSRSRSREKIEKRHKSSHRDEKRYREDRIRFDQERTKDRSEREYQSEGNEKAPVSETKKYTITHSKHFSKKLQEQQKGATNPLENYNLIDRIIESTKTVEEAANLISDRDKESEIEAKTSVTTQPIQSSTSTVSTSSSASYSAMTVDVSTTSCSTESDQEPTSTVSIPTPPHDPYSRFISCSSPSSYSNDTQYAITSLWTGNINMVDVTSFRLSLQPIVGISTGLAKLLPKELDVVGRIGPETVWDYISKIKKSPNKEVLVIRLIPANESETVAYKILYEYLDNRNRLGVIKSTSSQIKDFYIYPLGARKNVPSLLQPTETVDFYDDPCRPDVLVGIIVRVVISKRPVLNSSQLGLSTSSALNKVSSRPNDTDNFTPPGSPKAKKHRQSNAVQNVGEIDLDAIIKAPIAAKPQKTSHITKLKDNNPDEPYSPGGSSDDDLPLLPVKIPNNMVHMQASEDELKRKMEEINRQIAAQEMEIAGLLTGESATFGSAPTSSSNVLANISIPSNLSQILASIKTTGKDQSAIPPPPPLIGSLRKPPTSAISSNSQDEYNTENIMESTYESKNADPESNTNSTSLLAKLSEAELLSMVPDDVAITPNKPSRCEEPPPPGV